MKCRFIIPTAKCHNVILKDFNLMCIVACKIRNLAPSKTGKRPLLSEISNNVTISPIVPQVQPAKKKLCRNIKGVQIPEHKAVALSDNDVQTTQGAISDHVGIFKQIEDVYLGRTISMKLKFVFAGRKSKETS